MTCFVILHYIAADETITCVESIEKNVNGEKQIIIIDNFSPNNSYDVLKKKYENHTYVTVLRTQENLGFAKGNNFGYKYAVSKFSPDFIVVMNNDMEIMQEDFIQKMESSYQSYHYFILGPDVYSTKMEYHQNPQTRHLPFFEELEASYRKLCMKEKLLFLVRIKWYLYQFLGINAKNDKKEKERKMALPFVNEVREDVMLHGSCYVFSPLFIAKHPTNCFYSETFMYMEAEILYYLANKHQEKIVYDPSMKVFHHEDVSTDATFKSYQKSVFSIRCLKQSTKAFIDLINHEEENNNLQ